IRWNGSNSNEVIELFKESCKKIKQQKVAKCIGVSSLFSRYKNKIDKNILDQYYWEQLNEKIILKKFPEWIKQSVNQPTNISAKNASIGDLNYLFGLDNNEYGKYRSVKDMVKPDKGYIDETKLLAQIKNQKPKNIILVTNMFRFQDGDKTDNKISTILQKIDKNIHVILVGGIHYNSEKTLMDKYKSLGLDEFTKSEYTVKNLLK
ncbi:MAG: hypothetical protein HQL46_15130, partial [Gammaproteobacteria bacterium]|nr:hypothetical protein [Gammaproteobacteria bacterium]